MIFSIIMALTNGLTENVQKLSLLHAPFFLGLITGGAMIYWFTGASTQAVTTGAYRAVEFIKANIKLEGVEKASVADSKKVVEICTKYAQKGMLNIFLAVFFGTLCFAFVEPFFFIGYLISIAIFGLYQAIFMANAGAAWDNAKKIVEVVLEYRVASVIRGAGNMAFPTTVVCVGVALLIPLAAFHLRLGPVSGARDRRRRRRSRRDDGADGRNPRLVYSQRQLHCQVPDRAPEAGFLCRHSKGRRGWLAQHSANDIDRRADQSLIGAAAGPDAVAGYGTGSRLEYLLIPLVFGLGAPMVAMVGTNIGAGQNHRALRIAMTGAALAFVACEAIGVGAALWPRAWLGLFGDDPLMIATGAGYLRFVGPTIDSSAWGSRSISPPRAPASSPGR